MEYPRYGLIPEEKLGFGFTRYRSIVFNFGLLNVSKSLLRVGIEQLAIVLQVLFCLVCAHLPLFAYRFVHWMSPPSPTVNLGPLHFASSLVFSTSPPDVTEQGGHQNLPIKTRRANTRSRLQTVDIKFNHHTSPDSEFQIHPSPISKLQTPIFIQDSKVKTADSEPGGSKAWNPKLCSVSLSIYPTTSQIAFSGWG